jgi:hemerythrin-like domain-containing protein
MTTTGPLLPAGSKMPDGFDVLDVCHRQTVLALGKLAAFVTRLDKAGPDEAARTLAREIVDHFSVTARQHHEDEERHLFPALAASGDPQTVQTVLRLQRDHDWLEEDWMALSPYIDAVACGQPCHGLDALHAGAEAFIALSHAHIALEEGLIYPQARERLDHRERAEMGREMAARRRGLERAGFNAS